MRRPHFAVQSDGGSEKRVEVKDTVLYRSVALPEGVNADTASATFNNGVLEITLDAPQRNQQRGRQIEVREQAQK